MAIGLFARIISMNEALRSKLGISVEDYTEKSMHAYQLLDPSFLPRLFHVLKQSWGGVGPISKRVKFASLLRRPRDGKNFRAVVECVPSIDHETNFAFFLRIIIHFEDDTE
jgi:hypothetical protein